MLVNDLGDLVWFTPSATAKGLGGGRYPPPPIRGVWGGENYNPGRFFLKKKKIWGEGDEFWPRSHGNTAARKTLQKVYCGGLLNSPWGIFC